MSFWMFIRAVIRAFIKKIILVNRASPSKYDLQVLTPFSEQI
jgi:hypothetical protein